MVESDRCQSDRYLPATDWLTIDQLKAQSRGNSVILWISWDAGEGLLRPEVFGSAAHEITNN